jgi:hypothetical protein
LLWRSVRGGRTVANDDNAHWLRPAFAGIWQPGFRAFVGANDV